MRFDAPLFSGVWCIQPRGVSRARLVLRPFAIVHGPGTLQDVSYFLCCNRTYRIILSNLGSFHSRVRPVSMLIYWNKSKRLRKKRVQLPRDWFGTSTCHGRRNVMWKRSIVCFAAIFSLKVSKLHSDSTTFNNYLAIIGCGWERMLRITQMEERIYPPPRVFRLTICVPYMK